MSEKRMTPYQRLHALLKGKVMINYSSKKKPFLFYMFGRQWTTNKNRTRPYLMDSKNWHIIKKFPLWKKLWWIISGKVKMLLNSDAKTIYEKIKERENKKEIK